MGVGRVSQHRDASARPLLQRLPVSQSPFEQIRLGHCGDEFSHGLRKVIKQAQELLDRGRYRPSLGLPLLDLRIAEQVHRCLTPQRVVDQGSAGPDVENIRILDDCRGYSRIGNERPQSHVSRVRRTLPAEDDVADCRRSSVGTDKSRGCENAAIREARYDVVAVLLDIIETEPERDGIRVVPAHCADQGAVEVSAVEVAVRGAELGHE